MGKTDVTDYTQSAFTDEYGFAPERLVDLKALMGDPSDNIPGVPGVGEKTAMALMAEFGSLDAVYASLDSPAIRDAARKKLADGRESAFLSRELAAIRRDMPLELNLETAVLRGYDAPRLAELFMRLGFRSLIEQMGLEKPETPRLEFELPEGLDAGKIGSNIKDEMRRGNDPGWIFDVSLAAYVLDPSARKYGVPSLTERYLGCEYTE
jgi:DNA polymerase-1